MSPLKPSQISVYAQLPQTHAKILTWLKKFALLLPCRVPVQPKKAPDDPSFEA